jgi:hypothetical protein
MRITRWPSDVTTAAAWPAWPGISRLTGLRPITARAAVLSLRARSRQLFLRCGRANSAVLEHDRRARFGDPPAPCHAGVALALVRRDLRPCGEAVPATTMEVSQRDWPIWKKEAIR